MSEQPLTAEMRKLAEVGASLCCYAPGAGNPEKWPTSSCDCKFLRFALVEGMHIGGEQTGCCEVRHAWRALAVLARKPADARDSERAMVETDARQADAKSPKPDRRMA